MFATHCSAILKSSRGSTIITETQIQIAVLQIVLMNWSGTLCYIVEQNQRHRTIIIERERDLDIVIVVKHNSAV